MTGFYPLNNEYVFARLIYSVMLVALPSILFRQLINYIIISTTADCQLIAGPPATKHLSKTNGPRVEGQKNAFSGGCRVWWKWKNVFHIVIVILNGLCALKLFLLSELGVPSTSFQLPSPPHTHSNSIHKLTATYFGEYHASTNVYNATKYPKSGWNQNFRVWKFHHINPCH